jgi:hypothetical protein
MDPKFERLIQLLNESIQRENNLRDLKQQLRDVLSKIKNIEELRKVPMDILKKLEELENDQARALEEAMGLANELAKDQPTPTPGDKEPPPVKAGDVAGQFRSLMDSIQNDARQPRDGEVATTLKSLDVELKGLIVVENNEARIAPPPPGSKVDPGLLSTIRMSFGTIPVLRQAAEPPPAPTPAPRATPSPDTSPLPTPKPIPSTRGKRPRKTK